MLKVESRFKALGTDIYLIINCETEEERQKVQSNLVEAQKIYIVQEKIFSRFDEKSELSFLNNNLEKFNEASEELQEISRLALKYNLETKGLFDPRIIENLENVGYKQDFQKKNFTANLEKVKNISGKLEEDLKIEREKVFFGRRMDFSGIAKGYITDKIADFLENCGWQNFLVDSGGDIFASGLGENGEKWKIALENISEEKMSLEVSDEAIATSGITRRKWKVGEQKFHHLIDPKNSEKFVFDLQSVTVISENTTEADVLAKVLFLMGKEKGLEFSREKEIKSIFLSYQGVVSISDKAKDNLLS